MSIEGREVSDRERSQVANREQLPNCGNQETAVMNESVSLSTKYTVVAFLTTKNFGLFS